MTEASASAERLLRQVVRGIDLLVALQVQQIRGERPMKDMILMLSSLHCTTPEIVRLLGVPTSTVAPTVSRAKAATRTRVKRKTRSRREGRRQ